MESSSWLCLNKCGRVQQGGKCVGLREANGSTNSQYCDSVVIFYVFEFESYNLDRLAFQVLAE